MDSYKQILERMRATYEELSGQAPPELSDIDIRMKVLAGEIYSNMVELDFVRRQMFLSTATGEYLDLHGADRGLRRLEAVRASGQVRFRVFEPAVTDILIPKGTIVATLGPDSVRFETDEDATLSEGGYTVTVPCTAEEGGISGNVAAGKITIMVTAVLGIDNVINLSAFTGGYDAESDDAFRRRIEDTLISLSNGTNAAYYRKLAMSVDGVRSVNVCPRVRGVGTVDIYIKSSNPVTPISLVNKVRAVIEAERELAVDIDVEAAQRVPVILGIEVVLKDGYEFNSVSEAIRSAVREYVNSTEVGESIGSKFLTKVILGVDGVKDFYWLSNYSRECQIDPECFADFNSILIEEADE